MKLVKSLIKFTDVKDAIDVQLSNPELLNEAMAISTLKGIKFDHSAPVGQVCSEAACLDTGHQTHLSPAEL